MSLLDNGKMNYIWNSDWIREYESAWNIGEKLYAANLSPNIYNSLMGVSSNGIKTNFYNEAMAYYKGPLSSKFVSQFTKESSNYFSLYSAPEYYILHEVRYCPDCATRYGYHSIFHQLSFIDNCFIHDKKLRYLCNCNENGVINWKINGCKTFSCKKCNNRLPYPNIFDCITKKWQSKYFKPADYIKSHNETKKIYTVDLLHRHNPVFKGRLTDKQRRVLQKITRGEEIATFPEPEFTDNIMNARVPLTFMAKEIDNYINNTYNPKKCIEQFYLLERYISSSNYNSFDFEIITAYYMIGELICKGNLDRIYYTNEMVLSVTYDNSYNPILTCIQYDFLKHIDNNLPLTYAEISNYKTFALINYIYKIYVKNRYEEIKTHLISSHDDDYPLNSHRIPIKSTSNYPVFLILELYDGKLLLY